MDNRTTPRAVATLTTPGALACDVSRILRAHGWSLAYETEVYTAGQEGYTYGALEGIAVDPYGSRWSIVVAADGTTLDDGTRGEDADTRPAIAPYNLRAVVGALADHARGVRVVSDARYAVAPVSVDLPAFLRRADPMPGTSRAMRALCAVALVAGCAGWFMLAVSVGAQAAGHPFRGSATVLRSAD